MIIIDPDGLFNGDRLRNCSNAAQLHFPRLLLVSNGFARLEINYPKIIGVAYSTFKPTPSEADLGSWIQEYVANYLLFPYEADGRLWGQWDAKPELLPRYKTSADRRSPIPPEPAFTEWRRRYRTEVKAFPKCFGKVSETFHAGAHVVVVAGVDVAAKNTCASNDARLGEPAPEENPGLGTDPQPFPPEADDRNNRSAAKSEIRHAPKAAGGLTPDQEAWWSEFWPEYWRKRGKKKARQVFAKAIKTESLFRKVMAAVRAQKPEMQNRPPDKQPYPATWLNGECWEDEIETKPPTPVNGPGQPSQYTYTPPTNLLTDDQIAAERARKRAEMETKSA